MSARFGWLTRVDFFRKIHDELTTGTVSGGVISLLGGLVMLTLFILEFNSYLSVARTTSIEVDSASNDKLSVFFNLTFPALDCQYASVDVATYTGQHRINVTGNIRKWEISETPGHRVEVREVGAPKYVHVHSDGEQISEQLSLDSFTPFVQANKLVLVNFYAPWCIWSQRLSPVWEHVAGLLQEKPYAEAVHLGKVDCTATDAHALCHKQHIAAFPTVLAFAGGNDHSHITFHGDRSPERLLQFIEDNLPEELKKGGSGPPGGRRLLAVPAPAPAPARAEEKAVGTNDEAALEEGAVLDPAAPPKEDPLSKKNAEAALKEKKMAVAPRKGCIVAGRVDVRRVPGNFHVSAHAPGLSILPSAINTSHVVNHLSFGPPLTKAQRRRVGEEHVPKSPLQGLQFVSDEQGTTHEHYIKVVPTAFEFTAGKPIEGYQYTVSSHAYEDKKDVPSAKFTFDLSPMSVVVREEAMPFYHFLTSICAIIGGVFTVIGLVDSTVYHTMHTLRKKLQEGKLS